MCSYSGLSNNEGCFGPQGGKDACHLHCNIACTHNDTAPVRETKRVIIGTHFTHCLKTKEIIKKAHFGRVLRSKKPSLVMPRLPPEMISKHMFKSTIHKDDYLFLSTIPSTACLTWNFIISHHDRLPSGGDEDVRRCVFSSIHLHRRLRVIRKPGMTLNVLDFTLE